MILYSHLPTLPKKKNIFSSPKVRLLSTDIPEKGLSFSVFSLFLVFRFSFEILLLVLKMKIINGTRDEDSTRHVNITWFQKSKQVGVTWPPYLWTWLRHATLVSHCVRWVLPTLHFFHHASLFTFESFRLPPIQCNNKILSELLCRLIMLAYQFLFLFLFFYRLTMLAYDCPKKSC